MAFASDLKRNIKAVDDAMKSVTKSVRKAGSGAMTDVRQFLDKELHNAGALRDQHRPPPFGTYSARFSSVAEAEGILGHSGDFVHQKTGDLGSAIAVTPVKKLENGFSLEGGYLNNPPGHLDEILGLDSLMFERQPFEALMDDEDFQKRLFQKYETKFNSRLNIK